MLTMVTLSSAEAAHVAVRVLESTDAPHPVDGTLSDDRWAVTISVSGDVETRRTGSPAGATVDELLGRLVHNARRLPAHPTARQLVLLHRLEEAAAETGPGPGARALRLQRALAEALGADASERVRAQLADLVGAYVTVAASTTAAELVPAAPGVAPPGPSSPGPRRTALTRSTRGRADGRRRAPVRRGVLAALLLVVAVAGSGYVLTRRDDDASGGAGRREGPNAAPTGKASAGTSSEREERASRPRIQTLAPRQVGVVTGVELKRAGDCTPGALCAVTVTARFRPATTAQAVTWRVGTARSCNGSVSWSPPVSVTAQPGWTRVYASSSVQVPRRPAVALVATTTAPARAQSPPVPVTGSSLRC
jgi:hypothetical protein